MCHSFERYVATGLAVTWKDEYVSITVVFADVRLGFPAKNDPVLQSKSLDQSSAMGLVGTIADNIKPGIEFGRACQRLYDVNCAFLPH